MATVKDLREVYHEADVRIKLFGATPQALAKFNALVEAARAALKEENGLDSDSPDKIAGLADDAVLSEKAEGVLKELRRLVPFQILY